ncbi:MAG: hypothetical protein IJF71_07395 [Clostridia bacterium]|nr:hypothetical protein [Clostridia bacterium]
MKRFLSVFLILLLAVSSTLSLVACNDTPNNDNKDDPTPPAPVVKTITLDASKLQASVTEASKKDLALTLSANISGMMMGSSYANAKVAIDRFENDFDADLSVSYLENIENQFYENTMQAIKRDEVFGSRNKTDLMRYDATTGNYVIDGEPATFSEWALDVFSLEDIFGQLESEQLDELLSELIGETAIEATEEERGYVYQITADYKQQAIDAMQSVLDLMESNLWEILTDAINEIQQELPEEDRLTEQKLLDYINDLAQKDPLLSTFVDDFNAYAAEITDREDADIFLLVDYYADDLTIGQIQDFLAEYTEENIFEGYDRNLTLGAFLRNTVNSLPALAFLPYTEIYKEDADGNILYDEEGNPILEAIVYDPITLLLCGEKDPLECTVADIMDNLDQVKLSQIITPAEGESLADTLTRKYNEAKATLTDASVKALLSPYIGEEAFNSLLQSLSTMTVGKCGITMDLIFDENGTLLSVEGNAIFTVGSFVNGMFSAMFAVNADITLLFADQTLEQIVLPEIPV